MTRARLSLSCLGILFVATLACDRKTSEPSEPAPLVAAEKLAPWTWRPVGGYMVIEGELARPSRLILDGPNIRMETNAAAGPVRWEMARPASGEKAQLRIIGGRTLATWSFDEAPPRATTMAAARSRSSPAPLAPAIAPDPAPRAVTLPEFALPSRRPMPMIVTDATSRSVAAVPRPAPAPAASPRSLEPRPADVDPGTSLRPVRVATHPATAAAPFPGAGEGLNLVHGPRGGRRLVLTFDGGSGAESAVEILDTLKARRIKTTFFLTAAFIQKFPATVLRMAADGHELGNHTTTHPHLAPLMRRDPAWTKARVQQELLEADANLVRILGRPMDPYWRAPYGEHTAEIRRWAEEIGYRHVGWSVGGDSLDWATPAERKLYRSGERILDKLEGRLRKPDGGGLIVLMHLGSGRTEEDRPSRGLGAFMDRAMREGWRFVSVGDYLREMGKPAWDPAARFAWIDGASAPRVGGGQR